MKLSDKKILVLGLANKSSIAWAVVKKLREEGAEVGVCYYHPSNQKRVEPLATEAGCAFIQEVDVSNVADLKNLSDLVKTRWGKFDGIVHSIAFASQAAMEGRFHETKLEDFNQTLNISAFSVVHLTQYLKPFFSSNFSVVAMTYYGSTKVLPGYNVMGVAKATLESICRYLAHDLGPEGVRVNCISAGPIKTLAALGVPNFSHFLDEISTHSPLRKNISSDDVANLTSFLMSEDSKAITGQTLFVDSGMSTIVR